MRVMVLEYSDLELMRPLLAEWESDNNSDEYGIRLAWADGLHTFEVMATSLHADILGAIDDNGNLLGFMGVVIYKYHLGPQLHAKECCFYVGNKHRGRVGIALINAAHEWARTRRASHLILTASRIAGDNSRSGGFFERMGFKPIETDYVREVHP